MLAAGIIAEYNPFHNGHALHIRETRKRAGCQYVIAVMAGAFTQRGEPALLDKWVRTRLALENGVDLVIELPALFAVRTADKFALGGISLLSALQVVESVSFGCETDDIVALTRMADLLDTEPPELTRLIREGLDAGYSHARARGAALGALLALPPELVNAPNTVLALEYIRHNGHLTNPMELLAIKRAIGHHDPGLGAIAAATAIRQAVYARQLAEVREAVPETTFDTLREACPKRVALPSALDALLLYTLRETDAAYLAGLPDVGEGLEMRFLKMAETATTRAELLQAVKCKRYTMSRLSRICAYALMNLDRAIADAFPTPPYARILGFRQTARPLLRQIAQVATVPLIAEAKDLREHPVFALERRATDLWGLTTQDAAYRCAARDLTQKPVMILD